MPRDRLGLPAADVSMDLPRKHDILDRLKGGDRRSIGRADAVARQVSENPTLFPQLFRGILQSDPVLRMRAADAIEKVSSKHPELLQPYKRKLLGPVAAIPQKEVRWHMAQMLPRLRMSRNELDLAASILFEYLEDKSSIVRTFAMQGLADLAVRDAGLRERVVPLLEFLTTTGTPAMRSRGRKLIAKLGRASS
jgi:HEAT repeat protein